MATTVIHVGDADFSDPNTVYIGRANARRRLKGSVWANPFHIGTDGTRADVILKFRQYIERRPRLLNSLSELKGKRLACWCKGTDGPLDVPCHGDVLAELADASRSATSTDSKE